MTSDTTAIVDALLAAAQLTLLPHEREQAVADYPTLRAQADAKGERLRAQHGDGRRPSVGFGG